MGFLRWLDGSALRDTEAQRAACDEVAAASPDTTEGMDRIRRALDDDDLQIRISATEALAKGAGSEARAILERLAFGKDPKLRWWAFKAFREASGRDGWPVYLRAAEDESREIRASAKYALIDESGHGDIAELYSLADRLDNLGLKGKRFRTRAQYLERRAR